MIQRIQTVYLALSVIFVISFLFTPTFSEAFLYPHKWLSFLLSGSLAFSGTISLIAIFLYNNRLRQSSLVLYGMVAIIIGLGSSLGIFMSTGSPDFTNLADISGSVLLFLGWICQFLARKAIQKDEQLVKSMDRIR